MAPPANGEAEATTFVVHPMTHAKSGTHNPKSITAHGPPELLARASNPCVLSWQNLSYTVHCKKTDNNPDGKKTILSNVSGRCEPGTLTAIMGPSGCGKTTLVDILADRIRSGVITGDIDLNGAPRHLPTFRAVTSYVAQEDALLGSFSVLETLHMAARLALPSSVTGAAIDARVAAVVNDMGLQRCRHTLVGDVFRKGLSGGQKRRLSIAIELLADPQVLVLDEPTSGLDSCATFNVMQNVVRLCTEERKTVLCTIHQPSSLVYDMFSNVLILSAGETVFFGPRDQLIPHFAAQGRDCPHYLNPTEYFLSLVNVDFDGHADVPALVAAYAASDIATAITDAINADRKTLRHSSNAHPQHPSALRQFFVLLHRNSLNNMRNPGIYWIRLALYTALSFMVGTMYLSTNDKLTDEDLVGLLFYVEAFLIFMSVAVLPFFIDQRAVFQRERANNELHVGSYVIANLLASLPGIFFIALVSTSLIVPLAGLNSFDWFLLNIFLSLVVAESMMHVVGSAVPHYIVGIALAAGVFGMFMLCQGFILPREAIPSYWRWGHYLAFHSYSFEALVAKQFAVPNASESATAIIRRLGMERVDAVQDMWALVLFAAGFQAAFTCILYKFHTGRR